MVGERAVECSFQNVDTKRRRSAQLERTLSCGDAGMEIKCVKILCDGGTLMPGSDGLDLVLRMDVKLSVISKFLLSFDHT